MRFRALGPMEFFDGQDWRQVRPAKSRTLLAALLIEAGRVVSIDRIADELWGHARPTTADNQVHGYVSRLRRLLSDSQGTLLVTQAPGYRLRIDREDTDLGRFAGLVNRGRAAWRAGGLAEAATLLDEARACWRGAAFQDVPPGPLVRAEIDRLNELRVAVLEDLAEIKLLRGEHDAVGADLATLTGEHPLRERPRMLQMLALYRQGRQGDAITVYGDIRRRLADELGVDPSPPLRRLYEQILRADPALAAPAGQGAGVTAPALPVHQLPPDVPDFIDRDEQLRVIADTVSTGSPSGPPPVVVVVGGPGVGKSTLAVHGAHTVRSRFPDGQFYLDLAGTSGEPRDPEAILAEVLHALGLTGGWIPDGLPARARLYRSLLTSRRMLLVLDDVAGASQVQPLLPSTGTCAVVITSRRQLPDLAGARHITLDVFGAPEARRMFTTIVGAERVTAEPEEIEEILRSCGYLPLAIRISGSKLASRTSWPLRVLRERLADESRRLSELRVGELGVRASFDLSLRSLPAVAVQAFSFLGLLGAQTLPGWVLGPLLDRENADDILDMLVDANLVQLAGTDAIGQPRYRIHDLLRTYAVEAATTFPIRARRAAVTRLLATWLHLVEYAAERLPPSLFRPTPGTAPRRALPSGPLGQLVADPQGWFDAERITLLGAIKLATEWETDELAWELAANLVPYYDIRSRYEDWQRSHHQALRAVRDAENRRGEAVLLSGLAQVRIYRDALDEAAANLRRSLRLSQEIGDPHGEVLAISGLATIERVLGNHDRAFAHAERALGIATAAGDQHVEAQLRNGIAAIHLTQGRLADAHAWFDQALELSRQLGDVHREAVVLREMSALHSELGATDTAVTALRRALHIFEELTDEMCKAHTLLRLGRVHAQQGDVAQTRAAVESAATIFQRNGNRMDEASCWQLLGELEAERQPASARDHFTKAFQLWQAFSADEQVAEIKTKLKLLEQ